jgi:hypothetical protein
MDGTLIFLVFGVSAVLGVLTLHCRSYNPQGCSPVFRKLVKKES